LIPYLAPGPVLPFVPVAAAAQGINTAAVDRFSAAALRVAATSSNPAQDLQAIAGVLASLARSVVDSLTTTPVAVQSALEALGNGDVNGAFGTLESLILTPLEFFAIGPGPQTIADALTDLFPPGAPVFQVLPSVTTNVGLGLIDVYISTRQAIVDAVTSSVNSVGTLNPIIIASTLAAGISTVSAKLFDGAFGPTGVIATLVRAGQQILNALVPQQAAQADPDTDEKTPAGAARTDAPPSFTHTAAAPQDSASMSDASPSTGTKSGRDAHSATTSDTTGMASSGKAADGSSVAGSTSIGDNTNTDAPSSVEAPGKGTFSSDSASTDSSTSGGPAAPPTGAHDAQPSTGPSGRTGADGAGVSSTGASTPHHASSTSHHESTGAVKNRPLHTGSERAPTSQTSKHLHEKTDPPAGGSAQAASDKTGDK
jgi:hypothetical protein